jgi:ribose transport system substrate-binding protein
MVSVDALPAQLPYIREGVVQVLLGQQVYRWGWRSVELLAQKVLGGVTDFPERDISDLVAVTPGNVDEYAKNWETWLPAR